MALKLMNARDLIFEVSDMATVATWVGIGGLETLGHNPSENEEMTDTTTVDSDGLYSQEKMQLGAKVSLEGKLLQDPITGVRDPGQALVEAHANRLTYDSQVGVRFRYPGSGTWKVWPAATVSVGDQGGGRNDKASWSAEFTRCGAATTAVVV